MAYSGYKDFFSMPDTPRKTWKVLIADDEPEMHKVTVLVLKGYVFEGRTLEFISAYSSDEAKKAVRENPDLAIILLDIIMENDRSGLDLVEYIRKDCENRRSRIILRTGLPEQVPENTVILEYDINDYKSKQELTYQKLFTSITSALRAFITITTYEDNASELEREKELLAATLRSIEDGVIVVNTNNTIALMNNLAENFIGLPEKEAKGVSFDSLFKILSRKDRTVIEPPTQTVLSTCAPVVSVEPVILVDCNGRERFIQYTCSPMRGTTRETPGAVIVIRDETRRLQLEEEIIKVQKLDSIGLLAGGIAHDFNNILTGILGKISLARLGMDSKSRSCLLIGDAENAVLRAQNLTRQLLTFSKGNALVKAPVSVNEIISETVDIHLAGTKVRADIKVDPGTANLFVDKGQLSQVIGNLIVNAVQAMQTGGIVSINVRNESVPCDSSLNIEAGNYVRIDVTDSGMGIPDEDITRIFDPFFTTKRKGNGLGLTTSHMIVRRHSGAISVRSKVGEGSTFSIFLPAYPLPVENKRSRTNILSSGGKRVLLMDDDEIILGTMAEIIKYLGYEIDTARDGREAIDKYCSAISARRPFDAVIMDLTVPGGVGGKDAMRELRSIDPKIKAIVSSGYSNDPVMADYVSHGFRALISKPYRIEELSEVLHKVVEEHID